MRRRTLSHHRRRKRRGIAVALRKCPDRILFRHRRMKRERGKAADELAEGRSEAAKRTQNNDDDGGGMAVPRRTKKRGGGGSDCPAKRTRGWTRTGDSTWMSLSLSGQELCLIPRARSARERSKGASRRLQMTRARDGGRKGGRGAAPRKRRARANSSARPKTPADSTSDFPRSASSKQGIFCLTSFVSPPPRPAASLPRERLSMTRPVGQWDPRRTEGVDPQRRRRERRSWCCWTTVRNY
mmetsp:Transcript_31989/g.95800  ORF Transcript_31989/g.95800 Transcript_31989/m.95800 type:complete len:241 (-) Transcript_31989:2101-2823(-)